MSLKSCLISFLILSLFSCQSNSQDRREDTNFLTGKIFLVRHAEKAAGSDPTLSEMGKQRASGLKKYFSNKDLAAVLSTSYNRTRETADSIAAAYGIKVLEYKIDEHGADLRKKLAVYKGKNVVIVGHSNTLDKSAQALGYQGAFPTITESDFANIFYLQSRADTLQLKRIRFILKHNALEEIVGEGEIDQ
jgi:2,3-bisphosphoglycerate-dependent phosphoglycerate mutase